MYLNNSINLDQIIRIAPLFLAFLIINSDLHTGILFCNLDHLSKLSRCIFDNTNYSKGH